MDRQTNRHLTNALYPSAYMHGETVNVHVGPCCKSAFVLLAPNTLELNVYMSDYIYLQDIQNRTQLIQLV